MNDGRDSAFAEVDAIQYTHNQTLVDLVDLCRTPCINRILTLIYRRARFGLAAASDDA